MRPVEVDGDEPLSTLGNGAGRVSVAGGYLAETRPAMEELFAILREYNWGKLRAIADLVNASGKPLSEMRPTLDRVDANRFAREAIAGSILQIAFHAVKRYSQVEETPPSVVEFERQIAECVANPPAGKRPRVRKTFRFPVEFCGGRQIGGMPIGLIIYAGRNQYCHAHETRLWPDTELVFNYLHMLHPDPPDGLSFNLYDGWGYYAYSILCALGWVDTHVDGRDVPAYERYIADMGLALSVPPAK